MKAKVLVAVISAFMMVPLVKPCGWAWMYCRGPIKKNIEVYTEEDIDLLMEQKRDEFNSSLFRVQVKPKLLILT